MAKPTVTPVHARGEAASPAYTFAGPTETAITSSSRSRRRSSAEPAGPGLEWVLLAFRLPREPSTPRTALWRKLRQLGAVQLLDGLVALPLDSRNREQLEWLADGVVEAGGEAVIWIGRLAATAHERQLAERMQEST